MIENENRIRIHWKKVLMFDRINLFVRCVIRAGISQDVFFKAFRIFLNFAKKDFMQLSERIS